MKESLKILSAAVLGSALTFGGAHLLGVGDKKVTIEHTNTVPTKSTSLAQTSTNNNPFNLDFTKTAEKVMPAVVSIKATIQNNRRMTPQEQMFREFFGNPGHGGGGQGYSVGSGSGVIMSEDGYIITNNHVVKGAQDLEVALTDGRTFKAEVIGLDPTTDLALIKIKAKGLTKVSFVDSDAVKIGQWVLAVGNPFNLNSTVTAGIVSAKGRNINILKEKFAIESFIQTDAAINPGNSGGALVDVNGGLVGINTAIASPTGAYSGYGFAVPANIVSKVMQDLLKHGNVQRGILGVSITNVDGNIAKQKNLDITDGVYVAGVGAGSGAESAGMKEGDIIIGVDGKKVTKTAELQELIALHRPNDKVKVKINRNGSIKELNVKLMNSSGENRIARSGTKIDNLDNLLGADLEETQEGVQVKNLKRGKLSRAGVNDGFIITRANKKQIKSTKDLKKALEQSDGGVMLEGRYPRVDGSFYYAFGL